MYENVPPSVRPQQNHLDPHGTRSGVDLVVIVQILLLIDYNADITPHHS